jgi:hypothetical protein
MERWSVPVDHCMYAIPHYWMVASNNSLTVCSEAVSLYFMAARHGFDAKTLFVKAVLAFVAELQTGRIEFSWP